jgi:type I restriction enzyme S subunit
MSFPRYPAYKPSGVEWLGEVPEHWEFKKLKHCILRLGSGGTPESSNPEFWADDDSEDSIPWVAIGDMSAVSRVTSTAKSLTPFGLSSKNLEIFPSGSLLYSIYASLGKVAILGMDAAFNQAILAILPNTQCVSQPFLRCWLESLERHLEYYASSNTQANLNAAKVLSYPVSVPSLPEQREIATFLVHETAKIDALIAEQQSLIELLQEKRQAVISHAVTKGLNPEAPMKDSGVEWLGEVPEHWEVQRVKHLCRHIEQGWSPQCENEASEGDAPGVLKVGCVNGGIFRPGENKILPPDLSPIPEYSLRKGDLLISRANTKELVGSAAVVSEDYPWLFICDKLYRITVDPSLASAAFLALYLGSSEVRGQIELGASGASQSMQNISQSVLMELPIALPDLDEQEAIQNAIANECCSIDELVAEGSRAISLLQERRSALISAAVTGQIDVRGLVPEASAA